jgi:hypothetical protein
MDDFSPVRRQYAELIRQRAKLALRAIGVRA